MDKGRPAFLIIQGEKSEKAAPQKPQKRHYGLAMNNSIATATESFMDSLLGKKKGHFYLQNVSGCHRAHRTSEKRVTESLTLVYRMHDCFISGAMPVDGWVNRLIHR